MLINLKKKNSFLFFKMNCLGRFSMAYNTKNKKISKFLKIPSDIMSRRPIIWHIEP